MVSHSMTQMGKWARRIGGGALVLALAGLSAPATTSARWQKGEVIEIEDTAPPAPLTISPFDTGTHNPGAGAPNYDPSGGGSESGGGLLDGYGYVPSEGGSGISTAGQAARARLAAAKEDCLTVPGVWSSAVFKDLATNIAYAGYSCRWKSSPTTYIWLYYDSEGYVNQVCKGDLDVQTCDYP